MPHDEQRLLEVHIADIKLDRFTQAQSGAVQKQQHRAQRRFIEKCAAALAGVRRGPKQARELLMGSQRLRGMLNYYHRAAA